MRGCKSVTINTLKNFLGVSESAIKQYVIKKRYLMQFGMHCLKKDIKKYLKCGGKITDYFTPRSELPKHKRLTIRPIPKDCIGLEHFINMLEEFGAFIEDAVSAASDKKRNDPFLSATQKVFTIPNRGYSSQALFLLIERLHAFYYNVLIFELVDRELVDGSVFSGQLLFDIRRQETNIPTKELIFDIDRLFKIGGGKLNTIPLFVISSQDQNISRKIVEVTKNIAKNRTDTLVVVVAPNSDTPLHLKSLKKIKTNSIGLAVFGYADLFSDGCNFNKP